MSKSKFKYPPSIFRQGNFVISRSGLIVMVSHQPGMKYGLFSGTVIQGNEIFMVGSYSRVWTMDSFSQYEGDLFNTELLRAEILRIREENRTILRNFIKTRQALFELLYSEGASIEKRRDAIQEAERVSKIGCDCIDVEMGSYKRQVMITDLPDHMKAYKEKAGGDPNSICVDECIYAEVRNLWSLGITTTGCCCGHNRQAPYIGVIPADIDRMKEMGYIVQHNPSRPGDEDTFYSKTIKKLV